MEEVSWGRRSSSATGEAETNRHSQTWGKALDFRHVSTKTYLRSFTPRMITVKITIMNELY